VHRVAEIPSFSDLSFSYEFKLIKRKTFGVFVWGYNLSRLYNPINFVLSASSKVVGLYNLDRL
jgi:hypothetical protein